MICLKSFMNFGLKNHKGLSLIEIMMALTIFTTFAVFFIGTQQFQVKRAITARNKIDLMYLCDLQLKRTLLDPKKISSLSMTDSSPDSTTGVFPAPYQDYSYTIEYFKFFFPPVDQLQSFNIEGMEGMNLQMDNASSRILKNTKELMEKNMVQLRVSVVDNKTQEKVSLQTWITVPIDASTKFDLRL